MGFLKDTKTAGALWWAGASIRISHSELDVTQVSKTLRANPSLAQRPGESKVPYGNCKSAGYWCVDECVVEPGRPSLVIQWSEEFVAQRTAQFRELLDNKCHIDIYVGIHTTILALGFDLPATPTLWQLNIPVGIEFFS